MTMPQVRKRRRNVVYVLSAPLSLLHPPSRTRQTLFGAQLFPKRVIHPHWGKYLVYLCDVGLLRDYCESGLYIDIYVFYRL